MKKSEKEYIIIHDVISSEILQLLTEYIFLKAEIKPNVKKNDALTGVHREYGDILMETLLKKLTPLVEKAIGRELWPTLSFCYRYKNGQMLARHKDRSSCQIVAGLCIGADETYKQEHGSWPLILDNDGKEEAISLNYGDMIIFSGYETEHWREKFTGEWFISAIFGFVDKNGPFAFQKYDQRIMLGKPHVGMFKWMFGCLKNSLQRRISGK